MRLNDECSHLYNSQTILLAFFACLLGWLWLGVVAYDAYVSIAQVMP